MPKRIVDNFLYPELTYKIRGAMFKVHQVLGSGHKEKIYSKALEQELKLQELEFKTEKNLAVIYKGVSVGNYRPDFIVEEKVLIELKAMTVLPIQAERQLSYYLRGTTYKVGLLVNFGSSSLIIIRKIWDKGRPNQPNSV